MLRCVSVLGHCTYTFGRHHMQNEKTQQTTSILVYSPSYCHNTGPAAIAIMLRYELHVDDIRVRVRLGFNVMLASIFCSVYVKSSFFRHFKFIQNIIGVINFFVALGLTDVHIIPAGTR